jgi:cell division protein FtsB
MLKKFFVFLAILLAVVLILCWIYLPSITRYRELKSEEERLKKRIEEIDAQIKTLADERHLLQTDVAYLEKVIREELGFVKPGEIVYELVTKKNPSTPSAAPSELAVTSDNKSTSVVSVAAPTKTKISAMAVATALADTAPKSSKKKTAKPAV